MNPIKKVMFYFVSFFLVLVTIACSCNSLIPSSSGSPQEIEGPGAPTVTLGSIPSASPFIEQVTQVINIAPGEHGTATATCPSDSLVLSGGFASAEGIIITKTMPDSGGWLVSGWNNGTEPLPLTVYGYCLHNATGSIRNVTADVLVSGYPRVSCSAGELLTGGGYEFDSDSLAVRISTPDGNPVPSAWSVMAHNLQTADQSIRVHAVCLSGSSLTGMLVRDESVSYSSGTTSTSVSLTCPDGMVMSVGGYEGTGTFISRVSAADTGIWEVQVTGKGYLDGSLDHAVCLTLP